ncbi:MAG: FAD-dependent thymidylate synthase [Dehalococcoidia bacterium]|nr:FAD-dependent thymidylate synthase [Dehalococcoidia bacterium]
MQKLLAIGNEILSQVKLNVRLLDVTQNAMPLLYSAFRQCYSSEFAGDIFDESKKDSSNKLANFIRETLSSGHESPLEHVKFTFAIEGISRALTHQLVRHRMASYSQQSQRYVRENDLDYIIPPSIEADKVMRNEFTRIISEIQTSYNKIIGIFKEKGIDGEIANQDARFILPQAAESKIVVTMNCRELLHFFEERCCTRAQWEIRNLANEMLRICQREMPPIFSRAGAKCIRLGYCPEGTDRTCGKYPSKEEVLGRK